MAENTTTPADTVRAKTKYHHGDLRESLISAAFQLVLEHGADSFSLADACRLAGVSTAAPYKHFRDRDEILEEVARRGFDVMSDKSMAAVERAGVGTLAGMAAMGAAYIDFAVSHQPLFRLMFDIKSRMQCGDIQEGVEEGRECFGKVINQVAIFCERNNVEGDASEIAVRLWTFVHGAASLTIDQDYDAVVPGFDVKRMVQESAPLLLNVAKDQEPVTE